MYREPKWLVDDITRGYDVIHFMGGVVEPGKCITNDQIDIRIPIHYIPELVQLLTDKGYIKPTMSNESRCEDLKIIHRLLDIADKRRR